MLNAAENPARERLTFRRDWWNTLLIWAALAVTMLAGGYFRFLSPNWDEFTLWHPDERFMTQVVASLNGTLIFTDADVEGQLARCLERYPETGGRGGYFDAQCSPLNPNNTGNGLYVYGTLPAFIVRGMADALADILRDPSLASYLGGRQVGRLISALAEMGVIAVTFAIGLYLHGRFVGLIAAILYACTVFSIQQAHFWTVDAVSNLFVTLAILFAVRVQLRGSWVDYAVFGLFFGAALASRINTLPLIGLVVLAAGLRSLPVLDVRLAWGERQRILTSTLTGLAAAGAMTILVFRLTNPYAFTGPGFFGLVPNPGWLQDAAEAQHLVSGNAESPPNWQWVARTPYVFPFLNMVLWGMGIGLGITAWAAWVWSGWRILRSRPGALLNLLLFVWVLVYFGWLGRIWVMSMRYYLPIYPALAVLAAWGLAELVQRADGSKLWGRTAAARSLMVGVVVFTALWALMFTNIYRQMFAPAQSSHWVRENLPGDFSMRVEGAQAPLINIAVLNRPAFDDSMPLDQQASRYEQGQPYTQNFTAPADGTITKVYSPHLGDPNDDPGTETIRIRIGVPDSNLILTEGVLTADFRRIRHVLGDAYDIPLTEPLVVEKGKTYTFIFEVESGGPLISSGPVFAWEGQWDEVSLPKVCALPDGRTLEDDPAPGVVNVAACRSVDLWGAQLHPQQLQIYYEDDVYKRDLMQRGLDNSDYLVISTNRRYDSQSRIPYRWPMTMRFYETLFNGQLGFELVKTFQETYQLGPVQVSDQYLPTYSGPTWLNEFEAEEAFHVYDHPVVFIFRKTTAYASDRTAAILNGAPLQKADTLFSRGGCPEIPTRPDGTPSLGVGYYCSPELAGVVPLYSVPASKIPTALQFPPDLAKIQTEGGTWSERFFSGSLINTQPVITIVGWWFTILIFGWVAWPLLFAIFPGLSDRGYSIAKIAGLVVVAWLAWFVSSMRLSISMWSQSGILAALIVVALVSLLIVWRKRVEFVTYLREHSRMLLWIETITLAAFIFFLIIRLTNPDLWHPYFGGEKPMDFAYFNGVLRSTVFPPIDPWHSGGYINYYYFGYVIVGAPVLLLGIVPSTAYNLIIPTLFALTGMGAFAVAFNVVSRAGALIPRRENNGEVEAQSLNMETDADEAAQTAKPIWVRLGNPWVAGIAALALAVVIGNMDTPRVFINEALLKMGNYQQPALVQQELLDAYRRANDTDPTGDELTRLLERGEAEANSFGASLLRGLRKAFEQRRLDVAPNRWYWAPTRVIQEGSGGTDYGIAEFPFFTFLYGDLHAHMISMPVMFIVMVFVLNEVVLAGQDPRRRLRAALALILGGLVTGLLRATNTWDWVTFMLLGVAGLSYAWWLAERRVTRRSVLSLAGRVGLFVAASFLLTLPYSTWFSSVYDRALLWQGPRTQIWMYLTIHGLFLFLLVSLLIWDTGRWLRSVYVRSLRGKLGTLLLGCAGIILLLLIAVYLTVFGLPVQFMNVPTPVTIITVPLLIWIAILFFRQGQSREMQVVLALAGLAVGLTLGVEYVVLDGDIGRQNTLFKFYIQVWLMFSAVGGAAAAWLIRSAERWSVLLRSAWYPALSLLVGIGLLYPIMASRGRALDRMVPPAPQTLADVPLTLDGMAYMRYASQYEGDPELMALDPALSPFPLADDYELVRWMQENISGTPTIIEGGYVAEYRWYSRIAILTGLPTVNGWRFHQTQQRTFDPLPRLVDQRVANVNAFYVTQDIAAAWRVLQRYNVRYVVVGNLEHAYYPAAGLQKFDRMVTGGLLQIVYQKGDTVLYQVNADADFALVEDVAGGI